MRETFIDSVTGRAWHVPARLLTHDNAKTSKGESLGWLTAILYLAPSDLSGRNVCPMASAGCRAKYDEAGNVVGGCLFSAGRGRMANVFAGRINKTLYLFNDRAGFLAQLSAELDRLNKRAAKGRKIAVRLNGTSDLPWHRWLDLARWESLVFYDYTKIATRVYAEQLPANYSVTFSRSEENEAMALQVLAAGGNVAAVFAGELPETWHGFPLVQGDAHDLRFLDPRGGYVVGLTAKGSAKKDESGFVIRPSRSLPVLMAA